MRSGAQGRNRTTDTVIFSHVLYQLSYLGDPFDVETIAWGSGRSCGISLSSGRREVPTAIRSCRSREAAAFIREAGENCNRLSSPGMERVRWAAVWRGAWVITRRPDLTAPSPGNDNARPIARRRGPRRWRCQCPQQRSCRGKQGSRRARSTDDAGSFPFSREEHPARSRSLPATFRRPEISAPVQASFPRIDGESGRHHRGLRAGRIAPPTPAAAAKRRRRQLSGVFTGRRAHGCLHKPCMTIPSR